MINFFIYSSRIFHHFFKSTFGVGNRFDNAHSYLKNNPFLNGKLKKYSSSRNIHSNNNNKSTYINRNTFSYISNINTKRTINPSFSVDNKDDKKNKRKRNNHSLSNDNNKSASCISPDYFNPLINYKCEEENSLKIKKIRRNNIKNKDHFYNMFPTQLYVMRPHTKQSMYNYYLISQIDNLPGYRPSHLIKHINKGKGKKMFYDKNINNSINEEAKGKSRNIYYNKYNDNNKIKSLKNYTAVNPIRKKINNNREKTMKIYEIDDPVISYIDMDKKIKIKEK